MFDIGWSELLLVLVVALVVVGPKDLPRLMRTVGRWVGQARRMADQFKSSFDEMARESELDELRKEITALRHNNPLAEAQDELNRAMLPPEQSAAGTESVPPPDAAAVESGVHPDEPMPPEAIDHDYTGADETDETHKTPLPPGSEPTGP